MYIVLGPDNKAYGPFVTHFECHVWIDAKEAMNWSGFTIYEVNEVPQDEKETKPGHHWCDVCDDWHANPTE